MIIIENKVRVKKGFGDQMIQRFDKKGGVEHFNGFLGLQVLQTKNTKDYDEFCVRTTWDKKESHDEWTKSEEFKQSHSGKRPDFIIDFKISMYELKVERLPAQK